MDTDKRNSIDSAMLIGTHSAQAQAHIRVKIIQLTVARTIQTYSNMVRCGAVRCGSVRSVFILHALCHRWQTIAFSHDIFSTFKYTSKVGICELSQRQVHIKWPLFVVGWLFFLNILFCHAIPLQTAPKVDHSPKNAIHATLYHCRIWRMDLYRYTLIALESCENRMKTARQLNYVVVNLFFVCLFLSLFLCFSLEICFVLK